MIVLCLQYHESDYDQAMTLARFIGQIEPARREDVRFRFFARHDARNPDMDTIAAVGKKFDVSWGRTMSTWTGWPAGPNGMSKGVLEGARKWLRAAGWEDADGLLLLEPDCVPMAADWLNQLLAEWTAALSAGAWIMGSWRNSGGAHGHINGNCVIATSIAGSIGESITQHLAWDCGHSSHTRKHWHITGLIRNDFQSRDATDERLKTPEVGDRPPVLVHGYKDESAMEIARRWIL